MKVDFFLMLFFFSYFLCSPIIILSIAVPFKLGVENVSAALLSKVCPHKKNKYCVGLITNQTGVDQCGMRTVDILTEQGIQVRYIFAPEHGLTGIVAERDVYDSIDKKTSIPIMSLYGNGSGKMIMPEHIKAVDFFIFDIQDSGMRHYTYISTLLHAMKSVAEYNKPLVVLDRPNPLGSLMDGPLVDNDLISFISIAPIPLRHGMTIGEIAWYFNTHIMPKKIKLHVVKMSGYDRTQGFMGHFIHPLSPNIQSVQSCIGYSFLGLLGEVEPFDVGIGTPMAFRCITLPESIHVDNTMWKRLQKLLNSFEVQSFAYRYIKKNKRICKGLRLEFCDINTMRAFELFMTLMEFFKNEGIELSFSATFNKAVGTKKVQEVIAKKLPQSFFFDQLNRDLQEFFVRAQSSFLYDPAPRYNGALTLALAKKQ